MRATLSTTAAAVLLIAAGSAASASTNAATAGTDAAGAAGRAATLGTLLGPAAAEQAYQWVPADRTSAGPGHPDDLGSAEQPTASAGTTLTPTTPTTGGTAGIGGTGGIGATGADASMGTLGPSGGEAVTVDQLRARRQLAGADAATAAGAAGVTTGRAPAIPMGPLDASIGRDGLPAAGYGAPVATAIGSLVCPVAGPNAFTPTFGAPRSGGRTHQGTDLMAARGIPTVTVAPAIVVNISPVDVPGSLGGITVSYTTANGDRWYNAHLSALVPGLRIGQFLKAGETFGYVGTTGDARYTPPHLHIERHPGGAAQAVDAYADLKLACD